MTEFLHVDLTLLAPSPTNPRKTFVDLEGLAESIKAQGVLQPIVARPWPADYPAPEGRDDLPAYEIIAGERRYRASLLAGLSDIPVLIRAMDTRAVLEAQIVENLQRRDVTELEEAEGYQLMMREHGYSADELADKVGKSRAYIYGRLKLCALCPGARDLFRAGKLDASRALLIARIPVPALQVKAAGSIIRDGYIHGPMSAREAAAHIQQHYMLDLTKAPFPMSAHIVVKVKGLAGEGSCGLLPCTECPNRTGNAPEMYPGINPDVCTDPTCYADKRTAHLAKQVEMEKGQGRKVITGDAAKKIAPHGIYSANVGDYVVLDEKDWYGGSHQTARKAIKGHDVPIVMLEDTRKGTLVPVVARKDLSDALKAAGLQVSNSSRSPADLAKEKARKAEQQYRRALFDQHHATARTAINGATKPSLARDDLALVARQFWASRGSDACKRLARMYVSEAPDRGPEDSQWQDDDYRRGRRMTEMIGEFNEAQLILFLLDLALIATLDVPTYIDDTSTPAPLLDAARRAGLDPDAIRANLTAEKAKPKPSKTASTPTQAAPAANDTAREKKRAELKAKGIAYCHPENPSLSWSGRGKKPLWVECWLKDGGTLEELSTANQAAPAAASKGKDKAATAAQKNKTKAKSSGRASASGKKEKTTSSSDAEVPVERCTKTMDLIEATFPDLKAGMAGQEARA